MKRIVFIALITCACSGLFGQSLMDGLIIYYRFNGSGMDESGNGLHGIVNATLIDDRYGNPKSAYHFNGQDEYIDLPISPLLKPPFPFTLSIWAKFDSWPGGIFTTDFLDQYYYGVWMAINTDASVNISYSQGGIISPYNRTSIDSETTFELARWVNITGVFSGLNNITLYVDGIPEGTPSGYGSDLVYSNARGSIGRKDTHMFLPAWYLNGALDEIAFWHRALTPDEVWKIVNNENLYTATRDIETEIPYVLYPNPAKDRVFIYYPGGIRNSLLEIYDNRGKIVISENLPEGETNSIDIAGLAEGLHFFRITHDGMITGSGKFIKE